VVERFANHDEKISAGGGNLEALALAAEEFDAEIDLEGLPAFLGAGDPGEVTGDYRERVDAFRKRIVEDALARRGSNRTHAARDLGLTRQALLYLIRELGVKG